MFSTEKDHGILLALFLIAFASLEASASMMDDKRAGFVGMRGKKDHFSFNDYLDDPSYYEVKRSGSGFVGMRGKKDAEDNEDLFYAPVEDDDAKRAGFVGMRGKKASKNYWPSFWYSPSLTRESRGSSSGFVGMRGRRRR